MTTRRTIFLAGSALLVLAALWTVAAPAAAQAPPAAAEQSANTIVEVVLEGNQRVDRNRILQQMSLRAGSVYTPEAANEDFKRLYALHEFENIQLWPEEVPGGLRLKIVVKEFPLVNRVEFRGAVHIKVKELEKLTGLTPGMPLDPQKIFSAANLITDEYRKKGYYFASAQLDREQLLKTGDAVLVITEGTKIRVRKIVFSGNNAISAGTLQSKISTRKRFWPFIDGSFSEAELQIDVEKLRSYYVAMGFFDVQVGRTFSFDDKREKATVEFVINEGPRYRVSAVALRGAAVLSSAYLSEKMKLQPGRYYEAEALSADLKMIAASYGRVGYVHAQTRPSTEYTAEAALVDVVIDIIEGPKVAIGEIIISGNTVTRDKVILRELHVEPTDVADATELELARRRLMETRVFTSVDVSLIPTSDPNVENLLVQVEEGRTAQFIIGAGVSSNSGLIGNVQLGQKNFDITRWPHGRNDPGAFRGAGQDIRLVLEPGTEQQQYSLNFSDPYLLDQAIRLDSSIYFFKRGWEDYDERRIGGVVAFGKRLTKHLVGSLALRLENIDISSIDSGAPPDVFAVQGSSVLSSVTPKLTWDWTDSIYKPTTGSRISVAVEQAGALGGDYTFTKPLLEARRYWTVVEDLQGRRSVFSLKGATGFATDDTPIFERFYAGGQGSIRGFKYRGVGPHVNGEPVGGDFLLTGTAEYQFPLYGQNLSGVVFFDAGTVEKTVEITKLRAATGVGVRFTIDLFGAPVPFAFDLGFPLVKGDDDETQVFSFSIAWNF